MTHGTAARTKPGDRAPSQTAETGEVPPGVEILDPKHALHALYREAQLVKGSRLTGRTYVEYCLVVYDLTLKHGPQLKARLITNRLSRGATKEVNEGGGPTGIPTNSSHVRRDQDLSRDEDGQVVGASTTAYAVGDLVARAHTGIHPADAAEIAQLVHDGEEEKAKAKIGNKNSANSGEEQEGGGWEEQRSGSRDQEVEAGSQDSGRVGRQEPGSKGRPSPGWEAEAGGQGRLPRSEGEPQEEEPQEEAGDQEENPGEARVREREMSLDGEGRESGLAGRPPPSGDRGAIVQGYPLLENRLGPAAAAANGKLGDVGFGRLDFESARIVAEGGSGLEELERRVDVGLSRLGFQEGSSERGRNDPDPGTDAYLLTEMQGNYKQRDLLDEMVEKAPEKIQTSYRHAVIHLLTCAQIYWTDKWHPMHSEEVLIDQLPGGWALAEIEGGTSRLWDFEESVIQCYHDGFHRTPDEDGTGGLTRKYRIDPAFAIRFQQLAEEADPNYKLHEEDGESGKKSYASSALKTTFSDDSGHKWGREWSEEEEEDEEVPTGHYSLLDGSLRIYADTEHKIDISQITEMKEVFREEYLEAKARHDQAKATYENYAYLDEEGSARTEQELKEIREARSTMQTMETRKEKAEGRYHSLLSGLEVITRQADRIEDGIAYIQNAYEIQEVSGRKTFRRGGPQGLPAVLKSFAYSMEDVYNYDIKSSQTTGLRQLAEDLRKLGYDVDTEALDAYIDSGGKDWVIDNYDLPRSLVKIVEHAIKFGGSIPASMEQAYHQKLNTEWGMPEIAEHVEEYYTDREEQNRVLDDLNEIFGPQVQMIEDLAEGLLTAYWDAHSRAGGRGKGRFMRNHAGITFCKHDHKEPVYNDGELVGYKYGHEARSQAMAWYLQGLEAAYVDAITILSEEYDYEVMANEHDGCITIGRVPKEAKERARELSGFRDAVLTDKRFEDEEDVRELCETHGFEYPSPPLEETSTDPCKTPQSPGAGVPPSKPATNSGSPPTTSPTGSSPQMKRKSSSTSATPAAGGPSATTTPAGDGRASPAHGQPDKSTSRTERQRELIEKHYTRQPGIPLEQRCAPPTPEMHDDPSDVSDWIWEYYGQTPPDEEEEPEPDDDTDQGPDEEETGSVMYEETAGMPTTTGEAVPA